MEAFTEEQLLQELAKRRKTDFGSIGTDINLLPSVQIKAIKKAKSWHFIQKKIRQNLLDIAIKHLQLLEM